MNTPLQKAAQQALLNFENMAESNWRNWQELASAEEFEKWVKRRASHMVVNLRKAIEAEQAQAVDPVGYIRHSDKTFWLHPECAVYASLSPSLVPVYVSPTPTFTETLAAQGIKLRKEFESKPRDHVEADRNMVGERAELIQWLRRAHEVFGNKNSKTIADMLEADAQEIEGWKADQKENLGNQVELQGRINDLKAHQVAAPASLAAWLQWCLDNCDDSPEYNFGTTATEHVRALLAGFPAQMPPSQNRSKAMTLYGWMIEGSPAVMRGEFAELDAKAEAARIGGTCKAFAVYRDMPLVAKQDSPQKTDWSAA